MYRVGQTLLFVCVLNQFSRYFSVLYIIQFNNAVFENDNFIWKFEIGSNLLFDKLKIFKFKFGLNFTIVLK